MLNYWRVVEARPPRSRVIVARTVPENMFGNWNLPPHTALPVAPPIPPIPVKKSVSARFLLAALAGWLAASTATVAQTASPAPK